MIKRLGIEGKLDVLIFLSLILLVAITPLGKEATNPVVLGIYRTLLVLITLACAARLRQAGLPGVSSAFIAAAGIVLSGMLGSVLLRQGSHFDGLYTFYQNALFLSAFVALASFNRTRNGQWKGALLSLIVLTDIVYVAGASLYRLDHPGPPAGPFVNPNDYASYLLAGFGICAAATLFSRDLKVRLGAIPAGLILLYGIVQTTSRGAFLSLLALLAVGLYRGAASLRVSRTLLFGAAVLVVIAALAANPTLIQKFSDHGQTDPYNYKGTEIWLKSLSMVAAHPIQGVDLARYYDVSKLFTPAVDGTIARYPRWADMAHSEYLQYTAESGLPIALLMFIIGTSLFRTAWKRAGSAPPALRVSEEAAILVAAALGTHALVDYNWTVPVVAAGLAVISMADLLRFVPRAKFTWTPLRTASAVLLGGAIYFDAVLMPTAGLYFNEAGHQAYVAGKLDLAEQMHRLAVGIVPGDPLFLDNLGEVYLDKYAKARNPLDLDRAELLFEESNERNPAFDVAAGHLESVLFQRLTGRPAKDRPINERIVALDSSRMRANPYNSFIRSDLAEALHNLGRATEAINELKTCIEIEPNYVQEYLRLAQWEEASGNRDAAESYRQKAIAIVQQYRNQTNLDPLEASLLDRPMGNTGKP